MSASVLLKLLDGQFICPYTHRTEFEELQDLQAQEEVKAWLAKIDKRLVRLGEDGAFFCAPAKIGPQEMTKVRDELMRFRDVFGPAVQMFNTIRQAKSDSFDCAPGDVVQLAQLEQAINDNSTQEAQLRTLVSVIKNVGTHNTNRQVLKMMLEHLRGEGYLVVSNAQAETYQVTGKIDHLHNVITFIQEHAQVTDSAMDDQPLEQADLLEGGQGEEEPQEAPGHG